METIAAVATPLGFGALGIVRLSGDDVFSIGEKFFVSTPTISRAPAWQALFGKIFVKNSLTWNPQLTQTQPLDQAIVIKYEAPKSYTGENMVEIVAHGSPVLLREIMKAALNAGAREALAGEFTQRAYLNGKLDLAQAEAVCALIRATSNRAARVAGRGALGHLSAGVKELIENSLEALAALDVFIDHPDEPEITQDFSPVAVQKNVDHIIGRLDALAQGFRGAYKIREGFSFAVAGAPNAGKSTLFNRLLRKERSIVSDVVGTTRDTIEELLEVDGYLLRFIDTAGLRLGGDRLECLGQERSEQALGHADLVLWVIDGAIERGTEGENEIAVLLKKTQKPFFAVWNKADLEGFEPKAALWTNGLNSLKADEVNISALSGEGLDRLRERLVFYMQQQTAGVEEAAVFEERQAHLIEQARLGCVEARRLLKEEIWELASVKLREAVACLHEIIGEGDIGEGILRQIFSKFCVGK